MSHPMGNAELFVSINHATDRKGANEETFLRPLEHTVRKNKDSYNRRCLLCVCVCVWVTR
jgi:hypothetical protein